MVISLLCIFHCSPFKFISYNTRFGVLRNCHVTSELYNDRTELQLEQLKENDHSYYSFVKFHGQKMGPTT